MKEKERMLDKNNMTLSLEKLTKQSINKNQISRSELSKKESLQERGITLIALVVTIIILLILAGVTLNIALSDNGLFSKVKKAAEETKQASDEEKIKLEMLSMQLEGKESNSELKLGTALYSKNLDNSDKWHLIIEEGNNEPYGTGWRFIKKGENIGENTISEYSWLLNIDTGEIKKLEEGKYTELSVNDSLGTNNGLIFNLDPSIIEGQEDKPISELKNALGSGVELNGFGEQNTEESGLTSSSFNFDGIDDWIKVNYDDEQKRDAMIENGFTFEFYGDAAPGVGHMLETPLSNTPGGFGWFNGSTDSHAILHFQIWRDSRRVVIRWSPFPKHTDYNIIERSESSGGHWHVGPENGR